MTPMSDPSMTVGLVERLRENGERLADAYAARDPESTTLVIDEEIVFIASAMTDETAEALTKQADRIAVLEAALRPFADLGEVVLSEAPPDAIAAWGFAGSEGQSHLISLENFRAARNALVTP